MPVTVVAVGIGLRLKSLLDMQKADKYRDYDELVYIMFGAVFYTSLVVVLLPAEVRSAAYPRWPHSVGATHMHGCRLRTAAYPFTHTL